MWNVVQFPTNRIRDRSSGVRAACITGHWFIERLESGAITDRRPAPSETDARRIAARISRRDKVPLLPACRHRRPWDGTGRHTPNDAA